MQNETSNSLGNQYIFLSKEGGTLVENHCYYYHNHYVNLIFSTIEEIQ